jgi:hypothetical protein
MARSSFTLPVGTVVSKSLSIWLRNLLPFTLLAVCVMAPWIVFEVMVTRKAEPDSALPAAGLPLQLVLQFVLTGAITYGVVSQLRGQPAGLAQVLAKGMQCLLGVLGTSLLVGLRVFLFMLLLIVPGIIQMVKLYVAVPVAVAEGHAGSPALARSVSLTAGSGWQILGAHLVAAVLVPALIGGLIGGVIAVSTGISRDVLFWLQTGAAVLLTPLGATVPAVCYYLLRQGKENVDPQAIADVFR